MVLQYAGLQRIPRELHEAADLEGLTGWQRFRMVTLPQIAPVVALNLSVITIAAQGSRSHVPCGPYRGPFRPIPPGHWSHGQPTPRPRSSRSSSPTTGSSPPGIATWPEAAPNHVRNFLDLCAEGFYEGTIFHRVIPNFMIQGGDPTGTGSGSGPRPVKAEFSTDPRYSHVRGVLSMAHGFGDAPERDGELRWIGSNTGRLVDGEREADPYTGIPRMSAVPVSIQRVDAGRTGGTGR